MADRFNKTQWPFYALLVNLGSPLSFYVLTFMFEMKYWKRGIVCGVTIIKTQIKISE